LNKFHSKSRTSVKIKQTKLDAMVSSESNQEVDDQPSVQDQAKVTARIRQQVAQWQRKHDMDEVKHKSSIPCKPCGHTYCLSWKRFCSVVKLHTACGRMLQEAG